MNGEFKIANFAATFQERFFRFIYYSVYMFRSNSDEQNIESTLDLQPQSNYQTKRKEKEKYVNKMSLE